MVVGRPEKPIDWILVDELLEAGSNGEEVAGEFGVHADTLYRRIEKQYGMTFTNYAATLDYKGKGALRREQHKKALNERSKGSTQMLIWLGKVRLGQREPEPIREAPPNDQSLDLAIKSYKAPENQVNVTKPETTSLIPGGNNPVLHLDRSSEIRQDIQQHHQTDRSSEEWSQGGRNADWSDTRFDPA